MIRELRITTQDNKVRRVPLEADPVSLGRAHTNDLCYPEDASLSRRHLMIERDGENWCVRDLKSKNGTLLNGARITGKHPLKSGDRLTVGQLSIACGDPPPPKRASSTPIVCSSCRSYAH
jgi:pSer/pThr/pTyr-binding forkhead associated (FHA) protein